ncbi:MAG: fibronectin type III domain-containing protein, partial [Candidatus Vogelbacteria bacterium]|nr:fibronectin type III domain-containing protein [Candidatus Vogelbacteria bacterium]
MDLLIKYFSKSFRKLIAVITIFSYLFMPFAPAFALGGIVPPADMTPPVISAVVSAGVATSAATITWLTNELANSTFEYGITEGYGSSVLISGGLAIGGTAALTNLLPSTTYYYCIHATDASNNSASSCGHSFSTATPADVTPPVVSLTAITSLGTTNATITWTTNELATAQVDYGTNSSYGSSSSLDSTLSFTHSVTLSNLLPDTTYHYQIKSADDRGNLTTTSDATFTTESVSVQIPTDTIPPVISGVATVSVLSNAITIAWTTSEFATSTLEYGTTVSYGSSATLDATALLLHDGTILNLSPKLATATLEYGTTMNYGSTATLPIEALFSHEATLLGLTANTTYYYCIHATDLFGNSSSSCLNSNTFTTAAAQVILDTNPPDITLVTLASVATSSATVAWTTDKVANGYIEYGRDDGYGSETPLDTDLALIHSASILGLLADTLYHYRVVSSDEAGNISRSPDETFTTRALPVIVVQTPTDTASPTITDIIESSIGSTSVTLAWTTNELSVSSFEYGTTMSYGSSENLSTTAGIGGSATLTGLLPSTIYYYCIHARDLAGNTANSCGHSFTTGAGSLVADNTPPVIWSIAVASLETSSAHITWISNEPGDFYIKYGTTANYGSQTQTLNSSSLLNSATLTNLSPDTTYHFSIHSSDSSGNLATSSDETFTTDALPTVVVQTPTDTTAPIISGIAEASLVANSTTIEWITNE